MKKSNIERNIFTKSLTCLSLLFLQTAFISRLGSFLGCGGNNTKPSYTGYGAKVDEKTKGPHNTHTASQAEVHKIINRLHATTDNLILGREHTKKLEDILFNIENWNVE